MVKAKPWNLEDRQLLIGDAAHSVVPFYGQVRGCARGARGVHSGCGVVSVCTVVRRPCAVRPNGHHSPSTLQQSRAPCTPLLDIPSQGANAAFEDCLFFTECLDACRGDLSAAVRSFASQRKPAGESVRDVLTYTRARTRAHTRRATLLHSALAIAVPSACWSRASTRSLLPFVPPHPPAADALASLSLANYVEMRHKTATRAYMLRKRIDGILSALMPSSWIPLYSMVSGGGFRCACGCCRRAVLRSRAPAAPPYLLPPPPPVAGRVHAHPVPRGRCARRAAGPDCRDDRVDGGVGRARRRRGRADPVRAARARVVEISRRMGWTMRQHTRC